MPRHLLLLFAALTVAPLGAIAAPVAPLPDWSDSALSLWWSQNQTPQSWETAARQLEQTLARDYTQNGVAVFSDSNFQNWAEHLEWVELGLGNPELSTDPAQRAAFIALGQEPEVSHLFVQHLLPTDDSRSALKLLLSLESLESPGSPRLCRAWRRLLRRLRSTLPGRLAPQPGRPIGGADR